MNIEESVKSDTTEKLLASLSGHLEDINMALAAQSKHANPELMQFLIQLKNQVYLCSLQAKEVKARQLKARKVMDGHRNHIGV